ncbi:transcription termination factor NusA [Candidatus Babeliales bacterium]|nr:transcription termination factor NusA [Candidatus Babeliales bacterium]
MKLAGVIEELVEERGLEKSLLRSIICEGILAAYTKRYPDLPLHVDYDPKTDELIILIEKNVVASVSDSDLEISVRKAKNLDKKLKVGSTIKVPFDGTIGRIEILRAKQVIANKIRLVEASIIYNEFKDKEGEVVLGSVHKCERNGTVVKIQDNLAFLPRSLTIPGDKCIVGAPIRALLKEVLAEPRNENQLILDRVSPEFLRRLFELEIPEVYEGIVKIKKIVRTPGYKSKIIVSSSDANIDPVGTCVGVGGVRIKPILKELSNEKIDIIADSDDLEQLIRRSLKPAEIERVELEGDGRVKVWLDEDQRSLAIGKMGQNIQLASRLTGVQIDLVQKGDTPFEISTEEFELSSDSLSSSGDDDKKDE